MESEDFPTLDPVLAAWLHFRLGDYDKASDTAGKVLTVSEDPLAWAIKLAAITEENRILDEDLSDKTIGEELFGDTEMQKTARPGTSLKTPHQNEKGVFNPNGPSVRPQTGSRPLTGFARPGTSTRPGTGQVRLDTGRLNTASRPLTNQGRRLQTGQIDAESDQFLNLSRMNLTTFAENRNLSKLLFEHMTIVLGEYRQALNLAESAQNISPKDTNWAYYQSLACLRLGMLRKAEEFSTQFVRDNTLPQGALLLCAIYKRLDQPLAAQQALKVSVENNSDNLILLSNLARLDEARGSIEAAEKIYEKILSIDPINQEALCVLAASKYYKDEPMQCLQLYRRALQTGQTSAALYNNLALASIAAGQVDLGFKCFSKALQESAVDDELEQIWYNVGNSCVFVGEFQLAQQAYRISVVVGNGSYALNNFGVLTSKNDKNDTAAASLFQQAQFAESGWEAHWNSALLSDRRGDKQMTFSQATLAKGINANEKCVSDLLRKLTNSFQLL